VNDEPIMAVAATIWETCRPGTQFGRSSFSILTTAANKFMREIHDRMPVIVGRADEEAWLDPEMRKRESSEMMLRLCPDSRLTAVEVSPPVNSAKNNLPEVPYPAVTGQDPEQAVLRSVDCAYGSLLRQNAD